MPPIILAALLFRYAGKFMKRNNGIDRGLEIGNFDFKHFLIRIYINVIFKKLLKRQE